MFDWCRLELNGFFNLRLSQNENANGELRFTDKRRRCQPAHFETHERPAPLKSFCRFSLLTAQSLSFSVPTWFLSTPTKIRLYPGQLKRRRSSNQTFCLGINNQHFEAGFPYVSLIGSFELPVFMTVTLSSIFSDPSAFMRRCGSYY